MSQSYFVEKESEFYHKVISARSNGDFLVAFSDYMKFLSHEGSILTSNFVIESSLLSQEKEELDLENEKIKRELNTIKVTLDKKVTTLNIKDKLDISEYFASINNILNGNSTSSNILDRYRDVVMDLEDIIGKVISLGFERNVINLFTKEKRNHTQLLIHDGVESFILKNESFFRRYKKTIAYSFDVLNSYYKNFEDFDRSITPSKINTKNNNIFKQLEQKRLSESYQKSFHSHDQAILTIEREEILKNLERFHLAISCLKLNVDDHINSKKIFYIENDHLCHYKRGMLLYRTSKDPIFVIMIKRLINYFPNDSEKMKISDFQKLFHKEDNLSQKYRVNIGKSSDVFNRFLKRNKIENIHPINKRPIVEATDIYINFNNYL